MPSTGDEFIFVYVYDDYNLNNERFLVPRLQTKDRDEMRFGMNQSNIF